MPKPEVPLGPVIVKSMAVDVSVWFVVIPSMPKSIVVPLSVVAGTVAAGVGFDVGVGVGLGLCVGVEVGIGGSG